MWQGPQTIIEMFKRNVMDFPDREALVSVSYRSGAWVRHTWQELDEITDGMASGLANLGVRKGTKIAFLHNNCAECYYAYLGVHKLGAMFLPICPRNVAREVKHHLKSSDAEFFIFGSEFLPLWHEIKADVSNIKGFIGIEKENDSLPEEMMVFSELLETPVNLPDIAVGPDDEADLLYTTGTTGNPKGVILTESNKVACGRMIASAWGIRRKWYGEARMQNPYPFFTSTGVSSMMMGWLWTGLTMILEPGFDVVQTLKTLAREKSNVYFAVPAMLRFLLDHPQFTEYDTSAVKIIGYGGSVMPEELIRRLLGTWPDLKIYNVYGLTEGGTGGTFLDAADSVAKLGSIGVPWDSEQEARIVDEEDTDVEVGEIGEIILRGPNVMKGYYKDPAATAKAIRKGWLFTGDLAYYDEDGYFYYVDRKKDVIVRGGFNVSTIEVEGVLYELPAVKQCAVVAKPHPKLGEDVLAFVSLYDGKSLTEQEVIEFCADKLADYKRPREVQFVEELPTNPMGKIDKKALRAGYLGSLEEK